MSLGKAAAIGLATTLVTATQGICQERSETDYEPAFEQLTRLAGTWDSYIVGRDDSQATISYHVTSDGSVVWEEFVGDEPDGVRAMATAYHLDGKDIVATHYCGAGNQPRMRGVSYDPASGSLRFEFWDITNLESPDAYYTTDIELRFLDDDHAELRFRGTEDGTQGQWQVHKLHRLTHRPFQRAGGG